MTSPETTTYRACSLRLQRLACVVLLGLFFGGQLMVGHVHGADDAADPYDVLYDVLMTRYGPEGRPDGADETGPALFDLSEFPFGDKTFSDFNAALDAFAALPQSRIETYSDIERALMQRHLWKVFDATLPGRQQWLAKTFPNRGYLAVRSHADRRAVVRPKIASLMQRLALTRARILALPDTMAATVESGDYARTHDSTDRFKPFLPAGIYSEDSAWICLGEVGVPVPANIHSTKFKWRSAFLSFMNVPGGRTESQKQIGKINRQEELPVGTQFALIEQAFLISDGGEMILSPLVVSISLRAYLGVNPHMRTGRPVPTQCVAEFLMQPRQFIKGNAVMKALTPHDYRYEAGNANSIIGGTFDPFETTGEWPRPRLQLCMSCHGGPSAHSVRTSGLRTARSSRGAREDTPESVIKATAERKRIDKTWTSLRELWLADSAGKNIQPSAEAGP